MKAKVPCKIQNQNIEIPECTMTIWFPDETVTKNLLSICHRICQYQAVRNLDIAGIRCDDLPEPRVFTLSKNTESLTIMTCILPAHTLSHLIQQINGCSALRVLNLEGSTVTGLLPCFLPDPHPGLPQLEKLDLERTKLNNDDLQHLTHLIQTRKLPGLEDLYLRNNRLSETDVGHLIEACVTHHQRKLELDLWFNDLSDGFDNKWNECCEGTNIELQF